MKNILTNKIIMSVISIIFAMLTIWKVNNAFAVDIPAGKDWAEKYTLSEWEVLLITPTHGDQTAGRICLGPSKWHIEGNAFGQAYQENWQVPFNGWYRPNSNTTASGSANAEATWNYEFYSPQTVTEFGLCPAYHSLKANYMNVYYPSALYGFTWVDGDGSDTNVFGEWGGGASYPIKWQVTGDFD